MSSNPQRSWRKVGAAAIVLVAALTLKTGQEVLTRYRVGFNETDSLGNWGYIVDTQKRQPARGNLVAFVVPDNEYYPTGSSFVKRVAGVPGDVIERRDGQVFVAGSPVGLLKTHDRSGRPVEPGPVGIIPTGKIYVAGDHKDSLDSRYAVIGLVDSRRIIGIGEPIL